MPSTTPITDSLMNVAGNFKPSTVVVLVQNMRDMEQENEKLKADVARLREAAMNTQAWMRDRGMTDLNFDQALSETASSDAWLKERDAKVRGIYKAMLSAVKKETI